MALALKRKSINTQGCNPPVSGGMGMRRQKRVYDEQRLWIGLELVLATNTTSLLSFPEYCDVTRLIRSFSRVFHFQSTIGFFHWACIFSTKREQHLVRITLCPPPSIIARPATNSVTSRPPISPKLLLREGKHSPPLHTIPSFLLL